MFKRAGEEQHRRANPPVPIEKSPIEVLASLREQRAALIARRADEERALAIAKGKLKTAARRARITGEYLPPAAWSKLNREAEALAFQVTATQAELADLARHFVQAKQAAHDQRWSDRYRRNTAILSGFLEVARRRLSPDVFNALLDETLLLAGEVPREVDENIRAIWGGEER